VRTVLGLMSDSAVISPRVPDSAVGGRAGRQPASDAARKKEFHIVRVNRVSSLIEVCGPVVLQAPLSFRNRKMFRLSSTL
jgi:hypothetical protein